MGTEFSVDLRDLKFNLFSYLPMDRLLETEKYSEYDVETLTSVLEEAHKFALGELAPLNVKGDQTGCRLEDGKVIMPEGFQEAYQGYAENGWLGMHMNPELGGMGVPKAVEIAATDMFFGANLSFCLIGLLTTGTGHLIEAFGSDAQIEKYVEKMYTGEWAGTMCLTEPWAGSDVGALTTKATKVGDHYHIEGQKIFITYGDHDLTENIIHAVLARTEGAPAGTAGISLFIVPKRLIGENGELGADNNVECHAIEEKMGIHASPTCQLTFGANGPCVGYLLGDECRGMAAMFQMMNEARIMVGLQGSALANAAYRAALGYAQERVQGRHFQRKKKGAEGVAIIEHPDVRHMLMTQKAYSEAMRTMLLESGLQYDFSKALADPEERKRWEEDQALLTPICKAYCSDLGFKVTELAVQTLGGYGYCRDFPVEQYLRDTKIASVYEGTNGIQALDLIGRKLPMGGGKVFARWCKRIGGLVAEHSAHPTLGPSMAKLGTALAQMAEAAKFLAENGRSQPRLPFLAATTLLSLIGDVTCGFYLLDQAIVAEDLLKKSAAAAGVDLEDAEAKGKWLDSDPDAAFYDGKLHTARFFAHWILPLVGGKASAVMSADDSPMEMRF